MTDDDFDNAEPDDEGNFDPRDDREWVPVGTLDDDGGWPGGDRLIILGRVRGQYWAFDDVDGFWQQHDFESDEQAMDWFGLTDDDAEDEEELLD